MNREEVIKYANELIEENKYAIIGTVSKKKYPNVRVLKLMKREGLTEFYFSTKKDSLKVEQIRRNKRSCIFFYDEEKFASVMIEGTFEAKENVLFEVTKFYDLDPDPYDLINLIFKSEKMYLYVPYKKYEVIINEK
jgi:pyridoxine/pyridoxamine 5'-phosphate oxidase